MNRTPVPEAQLASTDAGLSPEGDGWFVVNVADAVSVGIDERHYAFNFEGAQRRFPHFGINLRVLYPGRPAAMYHAESNQEAFLVLEGECTLIVEDRERTLHKWDFFYCSPNTAHVIVGAGSGRCIVLMVGARTGGRELLYPASEAAAQYGASVTEDTNDPVVAYAGWKRPQPGRYPWPLATG